MRRTIKWGAQQEYGVANRRFLARVAAITGLGPTNAGRGIAAPSKFARTGLDGVVNIGNCVFERLVSQLLCGTGTQIDDRYSLGKHFEGQQVGVWTVAFVNKHIFIVG